MALLHAKLGSLAPALISIASYLRLAARKAAQPCRDAVRRSSFDLQLKKKKIGLATDTRGLKAFEIFLFQFTVPLVYHDEW